VIRFDGVDQAIENIGHGMGHSTPVGNHGDAKRIVEEPVGGQFHAFQEDFNGRPFLVAVEREAVDSRVVFVAADRFLRGLQIGRPQGLDKMTPSLARFLKSDFVISTHILRRPASGL